ncbi:hypothetical protein A2U01_0049517, partial [Trifolium medium]|nr:hypothetical protein [Trifolium medium]
MQEVTKRAECYINGEESNVEKRSRDAKEKEGRSSNNRANGAQVHRNWPPNGGHRPGHRNKPYYPPSRQGDSTHPQERRYSSERQYTPLNRAKVHVLGEILQTGLAHLPPPRFKNSSMGPDANAWCAYHRCKGHDTENCFWLRDLIEDLIRSGHLRKFLDDAA